MPQRITRPVDDTVAADLRKHGIDPAQATVIDTRTHTWANCGTVAIALAGKPKREAIHNFRGWCLKISGRYVVDDNDFPLQFSTPGAALTYQGTH